MTQPPTPDPSDTHPSDIPLSDSTPSDSVPTPDERAESTEEEVASPDGETFAEASESDRSPQDEAAPGEPLPETSPLGEAAPEQQPVTMSSESMRSAGGDAGRETSSTPTPPTSAPPSLQELWQDVQPVLKAQTVKVLKATIRLLEVAVETLEASPDEAAGASGQPRTGEKTSVSEIIERVQTTAQQAAERLKPLAEKAQPAARQAWEKAQPAARQAWEKAQPTWNRFWAWWTTTAIPKLRDRLPESVNQALSDRALSGIVAGVLVLLLWTLPNLLPGKPADTRVSQVPPAQSVRPTKPVPSPRYTPKVVLKPTPTEPTTPEEQPPGVTPPKVTPTPPAVRRSPTPTLTPTPAITPPAAPVPKPSPPPLNLTPEQSLIAAIQDQVAEVTNQYSSSLIQSIQANFRSSRLIVKVGDAWYSLSPDRQDKLANETLARAKKLDFSKLELTDRDGTLLARSPVIGDAMIILKRSLSGSSAPEAPTPSTPGPAAAS